MRNPDVHTDIKKLSFAGLLITLGIVYGDIGTSPLYTIKAVVGSAKEFNELLVFGSLSCVFWTLTLQTTIKYIIITLWADNKGEGGIFSLFALIRRKTTWAAILTMIGGGALLADGVITPAITVTSSIEGLKLLNPGISVIPIVLIIFTVLFFMQQFGTNIVGISFGPIMVLWFLMLGVLGFSQLIQYPNILLAVNPVFAIRILTEYPGGFILLGAVFLCTTGAEALYSDLGHCGRKNIRVSWIFVKTTLLLNYFGQGAWLIYNELYSRFGSCSFFFNNAKVVSYMGNNHLNCCVNNCEPDSDQRIIHTDKRSCFPEFLASNKDKQSYLHQGSGLPSICKLVTLDNVQPGRDIL